jgi:general L-amino acid transport system permease protein
VEGERVADVVTSGPVVEAKPKVSPFYDPKVRSLVFQAALCLFLIWLVWSGISNVRENLARAKIASGLGFWDNAAGFPISQTLIKYSENPATFGPAFATYGRAFWVGLLNTLLVAGIGIFLATILGFVVGIARLSKNFLVSKIAYWYVEVVRNLPLLLQLLFWYNAVVKALPEVRDSLKFPGGIFLNNRGLIFPQPVTGDNFWLVGLTFWLGVIGAFFYRAYAAKKQEKTGVQSPVGLMALGLVVGLPLLVFLLSGMPLSFEHVQAGRFNITGGVTVLPEFLALLFGLVIYTAAFIAEAVRAGILAVSKGQTARREAEAHAQPRHHPAGDARHHPAADEPLPQPDQELVARRVRRLPRPRQHLHRHRPEPDRTGHRGGGDHHARLSHDLADDVALHELVQQPQGVGGTVRGQP